MADALRTGACLFIVCVRSWGYGRGRTLVRSIQVPPSGVLDTAARLGSATATSRSNSTRGVVITTLLEAINKAVVETGSFYGQFAYQRKDNGEIAEVLVSVSDGQESGTPEVGSGVIAIEKKAKIQVLTLTALVATKQSMGVNYSLWRFVNETQKLRK